jgi:hypothetical protein
MTDLEEVFNEMLIEVCKTNETSNFLKIFRNRPINDNFDFN